MIAVEMVGGPMDGERRVFHDDEQIVFVYHAPVLPEAARADVDPEAIIVTQEAQYLRYPKSYSKSQGMPLYRARFVPPPS